MMKKNMIRKMIIAAAVVLTMLPVQAEASSASEIVKDDFKIIVSDFKKGSDSLGENPTVTEKNVQITYLEEGKYKLSYQVKLEGANGSYEMQEPLLRPWTQTPWFPPRHDHPARYLPKR